LGEHTDKVLADFGIENETISKLKDSNIISQT
jgi:crotonobetainyl-CoA:carnitine CoA-transferase CaiB-like acyl-CoA transferase